MNARAPRATRKFNTATLAALQKATTGETEAVQPRRMRSVTSHPEPALPARSRTATIEDPMTTQLLAEVARRAQTIEIDEDAIDSVVGELGAAETGHPHTRRRTR